MLIFLFHQRHLIDENFVFVEFGAGRGMLSLGIDFCLNGEVQNESKPKSASSRGKYLLLDISPVRFKADRWLRHKESNFSRVTSNIRDLDLSKVPLFAARGNERFVGIAKHLCGVATDYTIRCVLNGVQSGLEVHGAMGWRVVRGRLHRDLLPPPLPVAQLRGPRVLQGAGRREKEG